MLHCGFQSTFSTCLHAQEYGQRLIWVRLLSVAAPAASPCAPGNSHADLQLSSLLREECNQLAMVTFTLQGNSEVVPR